MAADRAPRQAMPVQPAGIRAWNFDEVPLGYSPEVALIEAGRCAGCRKPKCITGCPVEVLIPDFIAKIAEKDFRAAALLLKKRNSLPAVCGRVCPQETQCESRCVLGRRGEPVAIGRLERFVADWEMAEGDVPLPAKAPPTGRKIAVIGAGPAGLTLAGDLILLGHGVTVHEALHEPGGVLVYGIPEFRLPKHIVHAEVEYLRKLGVRFVLNSVIGRSRTVEELFTEEGCDAVFIGTGAGLPNFMGIPGENLNGVYSANEYLTRSNLMKAYLFPAYDTPIARGGRVAVFGGGNVAMDSARTALRLGAQDVTVLYRRGREEMPARAEEIRHAVEEGVTLELLANPLEILGDAGGRVRAVKAIRMELGEPDESGRRSPREIPGSDFEIEADTVVVAIGNSPNPLIAANTPGIGTTRAGTVLVDGETGGTTLDRVWAGGDAVTGAATVISAMGAGRKAANSIDAFLRTLPPPQKDGTT